MADPEANSANGARSIAAALRYRNYRLFFAGQSVSLIGTWTQRIAMAWLVYTLAGGDRAHALRMLGIQGFLGQIPIVICAPWAGVLIDRWDRRRVLVWTQAAAMVQASILAALVLTNQVQIWHVLTMSVILGVVNSFDMPARQSFVVRMIERREDLPNAIALNSFMVNFGKIAGPAIAGIVIAWVGEGYCFVINAISYVGVIVAVLAMRMEKFEKPTIVGRARDDLREGVRYVLGNAPIRSVMLMVLLVSLVGVPYTDMMPVVAKEFFKGGPQTFGFLRMAPGFGAVAGGLWLALRNSADGLGRVIPVAAVIFGVGLISFTLSGSLTLSLGFLCLTGFGMMVQMASSNTIVQTAVDDDKRGRVMSLYATAMQGALPWGSLIAGFVAAEIGIPNTLRLAGFVTVAAGAVFAVRLRRWGPLGERFVK
jgi:MFS family permease